MFSFLSFLLGRGRSVYLLYIFCSGIFLPATSLAQSSLAPPDNVSALVYSSSAVELFWSPQGNGRVEIQRNGNSLGQFDSRSLFQSGLNSSELYNYEIRSVGDNGELSSAVQIILTTNNFSLPIKRVYPEQSVSPPPPENQIAEAQENDQPAAAPVTDSDSSPTPQDDSPQATAEANPASVQGVTSIARTGDNCIASSVSTLRDCVARANSIQRIDLDRDIRCGSNCCPNGGALLRFNGTNSLELNGHGHRLTRAAGQRQCSLLEASNASNIQVVDLHLDDDQSVAGCQVADNCARMVHVKHSRNIRFLRTHISHGKGYAFYVQGTNGFSFEQSSLSNSGVLGMYIGHGNDASTGVRIQQSRFIDNQTNGLALLGVVGQSVSDNVVADNLFIRNHRRGQWQVAPQYGSGFTGGGQLYIAEASHVTVRNNTVKDGYCDNCYVQRKNRSGVSGIELGRPNQRSLKHIEVRDNLVVNHDGFGISQNANSGLGSDVKLIGNTLFNSTSGEHVSGASKSGNRVLNTQRFDSFEASNSVGSDYRGNTNCSSQGSVARVCGAGSRFGNCAVQLKLADSNCGDVQAELTGPAVSVRPGRTVVASGWVSNPMGQWCLVFTDSSGNSLGERCQSLSNVVTSSVQNFVGLPTLQSQAPANTARVHVRAYHRQVWNTMLMDDLKLTVEP